MLVPVAQARKTINRKRFLGEHERTVNSFACRMVLNSNGRSVNSNLHFGARSFHFLFDLLF
ncbi:MAG: hypothetical protein FWC60_12050 [Firmicutes bacterium]|nr:hypothetical protein [Bacillota bacterium]